MIERFSLMTISGLNEINKPVLKSSKPGQDISNTTTIKDSVTQFQFKSVSGFSRTFS